MTYKRVIGYHYKKRKIEEEKVTIKRVERVIINNTIFI